MSKADHLASEVLPIAQDLVELLRPHCERIEIAGSLRRKKIYVADIEILLVPKPAPSDADFFLTASQADTEIERLLDRRIIAKRRTKDGNFLWGQQNKLAVHAETGIPVDFFATTEDNWFNALFVRTGPKDLNTRVAQAAIDKGWRWHAYGNGFSRGNETHRVTSEMGVFQFVNIPFLIPEDR